MMLENCSDLSWFSLKVPDSGAVGTDKWHGKAILCLGVSEPILSLAFKLNQDKTWQLLVFPVILGTDLSLSKYVRKEYE